MTDSTRPRRYSPGHPDKRCLGCGTADGLDWWVATFTCTGQHQARCRDCYNALYRQKQRKPRPPSGSTVPCKICGVPFTRTRYRRECCSPECSADSQREKNRRENTRRRGAPQGIPYTLLEIAAAGDFACHICGELVDMALPRTNRMGPTIDHVVPISLGGVDCATNVRLAHWSCNSLRGNRECPT